MKIVSKVSFGLSYCRYTADIKGFAKDEKTTVFCIANTFKKVLKHTSWYD